MIVEILNKLRDIPVPSLVVVDIGAMIEGTPRYAPLLHYGGTTVVGFEPQQLQLEKLRASAPSSHTYLPHVLGKGGPARFHWTLYRGCSSLYEPDPGIIDLFSTMGAANPGGNFHVIETTEVKTSRLDDIEGVPSPDLVKIDVQGAELDVLEGGAATVSRALVIEAEAEFVPLYRDQPLFGDIHAFLRRHGFQFHKFIDVGGRGFAPFTHGKNPCLPISQLLWADAIFVRDFSNLPRFSDEDLLKGGIILDEVYRSFDLTAYLLTEYDRRRGSRLASQYLDELKRSPLSPMLLNLRENP